MFGDVRDEGAGNPGKAERFASGGRGIGVVGLLLVVVFLAYGVLEPDADFAPWLWPALLLAGVVIWVVLVRPAVVLRADTLELRNLLRTTWLPLARVTKAEVGMVTRVTADEHEHMGVGLSRSRRQTHRDFRHGASTFSPWSATLDLQASPAPRPSSKSLGGLVEEKLNRAATRAREEQARSGAELPPVRQAWAWPEIAALVVLGVATVVLALV